MNRRRTINGFHNSPVSVMNENHTKTRGSSLGSTTGTDCMIKPYSDNRVMAKRQPRMSSGLLADNRVSKDLSPKHVNAKSHIFFNTSSIDLSKPSSSTPELHSCGLPVCDTLKKVFRNGSNSGSQIKSNRSSEKMISRSIIEESLLSSHDGSYLEVFSKESGQKEPKNKNDKDPERDSDARGSRIYSLSTSKAEKVFVLDSPKSNCQEQQNDWLKSTIDQSIIDESMGEGVTVDKTVENPLKGVVAFIDVRSSNENRFDGIALELEKMGATAVNKFSPEVTHAIFKNGKKSTIKLVEKHDVHFVSVLWVDSCKQNWSRVDEERYPATKNDTDSPIGNLRGKYKRLKSLQPKAFDVDLNHSGKLEGKRKRRNVTKEKNLELNLDLVLYENPDKMDLSKVMQEPDSIVNSPIGNESPFFKQVQKRWAEKRASLGALPSPMNFSLIEEDTEEMQVDDVKENIEKILDSSEHGNVTEASSLERTKSTVKDNIGCEGQSPPEIPSKVTDIRAAGDRELNVSKKPEGIESESEFKTQFPKTAEEIESESEFKTQIIEGSYTRDVGGSETKMKSIEAAIENRVVTTYKSANKESDNQTEIQYHENSITKEHLGSESNVSDRIDKAAEDDEVIKKGSLVEKNIDENTANCSNIDKEWRCTKSFKRRRKLLAKNHYMAPISPAVHEEKPKEITQVSNKKPVCKNQEHINTENDHQPSPSNKRKRQSPVDSRKRQKQNGENLNESFNVNEKIERPRPMISEADKDERMLADVELASETDTCASELDEKPANECINERKTSKSKKKNTKTIKMQKRSLVMTSLHFSEQKFIRTAVARLGSFHLSENVNSSTTHVIAGNNRRTLNILNGIIQGSWILSPDWVCASYNQGIWLDEDEYELNKDFPMAQVNRLKKVETGESLVAQLLKDQVPFFVAEDTSPPSEVIQKLIRKCGGQFTSCIRKAEICIGKCKQQETNIKEVEEKWLLDCIMKSKILDISDYLIQRTKDAS